MGTRKNAKRAVAQTDDDICPTCMRKHHDGAAALLETLLAKVGAMLAQGELKPTIADYLRLLQFREEIRGDEQPKEIRVTWVEPVGKSDSEG